MSLGPLEAHALSRAAASQAPAEVVDEQVREHVQREEEPEVILDAREMQRVLELSEAATATEEEEVLEESSEEKEEQASSNPGPQPSVKKAKGPRLPKTHTKEEVKEKGRRRKQIQELVNKRERFRAKEYFEAADKVRQELEKMEVKLNDAKRVWTAPGLQGTILTGGQEVNCTISTEDVMLKVAMYQACVATKRFIQATYFKEALRKEGVELIDGSQRWRSVDGRSGDYLDAVRYRKKVGPKPILLKPQAAAQEPSTAKAKDGE